MRAAGQIAVLTTLLIGLGTAPSPALAAPAAEGGGIVADADRLPWMSFQGRIAYTAVPAWRSDFGFTDTSGGVKLGGTSVMGDVYLGGSRRGFRATSGVLVGPRHGLWGSATPAASSGWLGVDGRFAGTTALGASVDPAAESSTLPYLGVGYSSLRSRGGWSFSADLGLMSYAPGNVVRFGRGQSLDEVVRDMRFAPVFQLGVSYSF